MPGAASTLHADWAEALGNPYGYRRVDTFSAVMSARHKTPATVTHRFADWLSPAALHRSQLGNESTTAQFDPQAFTSSLADAAVAAGTKLEIATVSGLAKAGRGDRVSGVTLEDGRTIAADAVILALGPWSLLACRWVGLAPVYGLKGHSLIFRPKDALPAEAIFAEIEDADGDILTPEVVPRSDGTVYVCGLSGSDALPVDPAQVLPEAGGPKRLREISCRLIPSLVDAEVIAEQACYRPVTSDGMPLIGLLCDIAGLYVATGHSVWGMLNAPGTAEALAELIIDGEPRHVDLAPFTPDRLPPLDPGMLELRARP